MTCPRCGKEFEVYQARIEFECFYNNRLKYNDWFPRTRLCGNCAIDDTETCSQRKIVKRGLNNEAFILRRDTNGYMRKLRTVIVWWRIDPSLGRWR